MLDAEEISAEARELLRVLPEDQQEAAVALAGGLNKRQASRSVGVSYRTMLRWTQDEEFNAARRAISDHVHSHQVRAALEAFFEILEKDVEAGRGTNVRWFLNRTLFRDFELERANNKRPGVNLILPGSVAEACERTSSTVSHVWKSRHEEVAGRTSAALPEL